MYSYMCFMYIYWIMYKCSSLIVLIEKREGERDRERKNDLYHFVITICKMNDILGFADREEGEREREREMCICN